MSPRTLIVGFGNPLRGDDGVGWTAAQQLESQFSDPGVRVLACHQLTPELAADAAWVDRLVLIDASSETTPGSVVVEKLEPSEIPTNSFSHHLRPTDLLDCARQLYGSCPEAWMVSIGGESFEHGDKLSIPVAAALPEALARVESLVKQEICTS